MNAGPMQFSDQRRINPREPLSARMVCRQVIRIAAAVCEISAGRYDGFFVYIDWNLTALSNVSLSKERILSLIQFVNSDAHPKTQLKL
jgi:hypothetical protein